MDGQCGLVNAANPCRCANKTQAFMRAGYVDPSNLLFATGHMTRVRELAPKAHEHLESLDAAYAGIHRDHPFHAGPDFVASLRKLIGGLTIMLVLLSTLAAGACGTMSDNDSPDAIIALETGALDRWGKGQPQGYYDIMAAEETYFDPLTEKRVDGQEALKAHIAPFDGKISIEHYEMINPKVQRDGNIAVLTFNLVDVGSIAGGPKETAHWNSTEVYKRIDGTWKIIHSHWSYVKPDIRPKA